MLQKNVITISCMSIMRELIDSGVDVKIFVAGIVRQEVPVTNKILTLIRNDERGQERMIPFGEVDFKLDDPSSTNFISLGAIRKRFNRLDYNSPLLWAFHTESKIDVMKRALARVIWEQTNCFVRDKDCLKSILVFEKETSESAREFVVLFRKLQLFDAYGNKMCNAGRQCFTPNNVHLYYTYHQFMSVDGNYGFDPLCLELVKNVPPARVIY